MRRTSLDLLIIYLKGISIVFGVLAAIQSVCIPGFWTNGTEILLRAIFDQKDSHHNNVGILLSVSLGVGICVFLFQKIVVHIEVASWCKAIERKSAGVNSRGDRFTR